MLELQFIGEFESTVDAKQRFLFPAAFKKLLSPDSPTSFFINRGKENCLTLFTKDRWNSIIQEKFATLDYDGDENAREYQRAFLNGATEIEFDAAGRLLLPKNLSRHANIEKDIVVTGAIDRIEIWNAEIYYQRMAAMTNERYSELGRINAKPKQIEEKKN